MSREDWEGRPEERPTNPDPTRGLKFESTLAEVGDNPRHRPCRPHLRAHFCARQIAWRRTEHAELAALAGRPEPPRVPSSFSLTDAELRTEFTRLVEAGWTAAEVRAVLELRGAS